MTLLATILLAPAAIGDYAAEVGLVGAGGFSRSLSLTDKGRFFCGTRGCFSSETFSGRFRQIGSVVVLLPNAESRGRFPLCYRFRTVDGVAYLFALPTDDSERPGPLTLRRQGPILPV